MISVIICSINKDFAEQVTVNIRKTIGVDWELLLIDNSLANDPITKVYNEAARRAQHDILCFVHEDVVFKDLDWGQTIKEMFDNDQRLGMIGVAGSKYKSKVFSGWYTGLNSLDCCNILHVNAKNEETLLYGNPDPSNKKQEVTSLDGVFICTKQSVWNNIRFDEKMLDGFHCYDIDFSVRASKHYKILVTYEIHMLHLTDGGNFGNSWVDYTIRWHKAQKRLLPSFAPVSVWTENRNNEFVIMRNWLLRLKKEMISFDRKINWVIRSGSVLDPRLWPAIFVFFTFRTYKKIRTLLRPKKLHYIPQ